MRLRFPVHATVRAVRTGSNSTHAPCSLKGVTTRTGAHNLRCGETTQQQPRLNRGTNSALDFHVIGGWRLPPLIFFIMQCFFPFTFLSFHKVVTLCIPVAMGMVRSDKFQSQRPEFKNTSWTRPFSLLKRCLLTKPRYTLTCRHDMGWVTPPHACTLNHRALSLLHA